MLITLEKPENGSEGSEIARSKVGHVAMIIPRGEVMRNFVYTQCLDDVSERSRLSLLTVSPSQEMEQTLTEKYGHVFELSELDEKWIVRLQRDLLDMAHGRFLWSQAARRRWRIRDQEATSADKRIKRLAKKTLSKPFANAPGIKLLSASERASSRWLNSSTRYRDLYQEIKPTLVFNGSHIHSRNAIQAVQAAQWLGIPTATFIFSWDNLTSQGRITLPYDYFLVWNESLKVQLLEMYDWIKPGNVFVTGSPQFDFHFRPQFHLSRENFCDRVGADPARPIIFYATGMPNHMPGEPEIVEGIADILRQEFDVASRPQLLVRVYPKDRSQRFDELKQRRGDILFPKVEWEQAWLTPKFEDSYDLVNTLRHCAMGINVASTVSLELCMFDRPAINVGYNPKSVDEAELSFAEYYGFDHYKPVVESGAVQVANSENELANMIRSALANPGERSPQRKQLIKNMFGSTLDGRSSQRVADTLVSLAAGSI